MEVLFLGSVINTKDCTKYIGPSVAGNKMQIGIIKGLSKRFKNKLTVFTQVPIGAFPKEKKIWLGNGKIHLVDNTEGHKIPSINILILKQLFFIINTCIMLVNWSIKNRKEEKIILTFNAFLMISLPVLLVAKIFKVKNVCIFADPPIDVEQRGAIGRIGKKIENVITTFSIKKYDGLIVLNEKSIEKYAPSSKYILIDGGFDLDDCPANPPGGQWLTTKTEDVITGVFSGALFEYNGVKNLVLAMKYIKSDNFHLKIYGTGPLDEYIKEATSWDNRIKFMGNISNDKILKVQQEAGILINPRKVNDAISLYTFPSKMIEYFLSGTPVATTKLNGLTKEYFDNSFVFQDESPEEIARTIDYIMSQDKAELIKRGTSARDFIVNNKNWDKHCHEIAHFLKNINIGEHKY